MKMKMMVGALTAVLLLVGCNSSATPAKQGAAKATVTEESLGLRKTDLYSEDTTVAAETKYGTKAAGSGHTFERAFDNAPPMIPHDTEGMLPITINDNQCKGCHMPEVATSMGATPIPKSHFTDMRPKTVLAVDGAVIKEGTVMLGDNKTLTVQHKLASLSGSRFNCSQCHAPQSTGDLLVENNFRPDYQNAGMKRGSSLLDTINAGVE